MGAAASAPVPTRLTTNANPRHGKSARAPPAHVPREAATPTPSESEAFARLELPAGGGNDVDPRGQGAEVVREAGVVRADDLAAADHDR